MIVKTMVSTQPEMALLYAGAEDVRLAAATALECAVAVGADVEVLRVVVPGF